MKKITRTISIFTGEEVKANFDTLTFEKKPFTVYDESDIPENAKNVNRKDILYSVTVEDFLKVAKVAKEGEENA